MAEQLLVEPDDDLIPLLRDASNEMLDPLVGYLTTTKDGIRRITCELDTLKIYRDHSPNHRCYCDDIAAEIQKYGGNTLANIARAGEGVPYREIVRDVAKKLNVDISDTMHVPTIEMQILLKILGDAWQRMGDAQKRELLHEIGSNQGTIPAALPIVALQIAIRSSGFLAYQIAAIVADAVAGQILGQGLLLAASPGVMQGLAVFSGPVGLVVGALWAAYDLAGPAYRITVPCVIQVAMIRQQSLMKNRLNGQAVRNGREALGVEPAAS